MLGATRAVEMASLTAHATSGLHGAWTHITAGDMGGSVLVTITAAGCVLILAVAIAASEIIRVKVQRYVQRHEQRSLPEQRHKRGLDT